MVSKASIEDRILKEDKRYEFAPSTEEAQLDFNLKIKENKGKCFVKWNHILDISILLASFPPFGIIEIQLGNATYDLSIIMF